MLPSLLLPPLLLPPLVPPSLLLPPVPPLLLPPLLHLAYCEQMAPVLAEAVIELTAAGGVAYLVSCATHVPCRDTCTPALSPPLLPPRAREYVLLATLYVWLLLPKVSRATRRLGLEQLLALLAEAGSPRCRQGPGLRLGLGWGLGFGLG